MQDQNEDSLKTWVRWELLHEIAGCELAVRVRERELAEPPGPGAPDWQRRLHDRAARELEEFRARREQCAAALATGTLDPSVLPVELHPWGASYARPRQAPTPETHFGEVWLPVHPAVAAVVAEELRQQPTLLVQVVERWETPRMSGVFRGWARVDQGRVDPLTRNFWDLVGSPVEDVIFGRGGPRTFYFYLPAEALAVEL